VSAKIVLNTDPSNHPLEEEFRQQIEEAGGTLVDLDPPSDEQFAVHAREAFALLCSDFPLTAERIAMLDRCQIISGLRTGLDYIDVPAAKARGIIVTNVPEFCTEEVADRAWLLLLACACDLLGRDRSVRSGVWREHGLDFHAPVGDRTLGLIGLGKIGRAMARRAKASRMKVVAYSPPEPDKVFAEQGVERMDLDVLLAKADYVSLHCPFTEKTRHLIDARRIGLMKPTAVLINCARGGIVDQAALVAALKERRIAAAGLDVFDPEPPGKDSPLYSLDNVILTPHNASCTHDAVRRVRQQAIESVVCVLRGELPPDHVTVK